MQFEPEELLAKYDEEKRKRLQNRPEGNAQYIAVSSVLRDYNRDPLAESIADRASIEADTDVLIVGAGFGFNHRVSAGLVR